MTVLAAAGYLSDDTRTQGEIKTALENWLQGTKELLGGEAETTLTITAGTVTPIGGCHRIDTEAGATTDDLTTIQQTNHPDGRLLLLRIAQANRVVTFKHAAGGAGQITLAAGVDRTLRQTTDWILLKRTGTLWEEVLTSGGGVPTGSLMMWATASAPFGWLVCEGQLVSRAAYAALFQVLGTLYGAGDGSTTFGIPDLRGRGPMGIGAGSITTLGQRGGAESVAIGGHAHNVAGGTDAGVGQYLTNPAPGNALVGTHTHNVSGYTDTQGAHAVSVLSPYFGTTFIIKI